MLDEILTVKVAAEHFACDVIGTAYCDEWQMLRFHFLDGAVLYLVEGIASDLGTCGADVSVSTGEALLAAAPVAAFGQVGVLGRKELEGLAGVVAEDLLLVGFGAVVAAAHGEVGVALGVLALADLDGGAAAAPAVGG